MTYRCNHYENCTVEECKHKIPHQYIPYKTYGILGNKNNWLEEWDTCDHLICDEVVYEVECIEYYESSQT